MAKSAIKCVLLLIFGILVFLILRIAELLSIYDLAYTSVRFIDPFSLSVNKLKIILDQRGINYEGVVEKTELDDMVVSSGKVTEADTASAIQNYNYSDVSHITDFNGQEHFYELVEDCKDSVWLILITAVDKSSMLTTSKWHHLVQKVSRFGVRSGEIKCGQQQWFCEQRGFVDPALLLALPERRDGTKQRIVLYVLTGTNFSLRHLFEWVASHLSSRVPLLNHPTQLEHKTWRRANHVQQIDLIWLTHRASDTMPLLFAALAVKFNGRVRLWRLNQDDEAKSGKSWDLLHSLRKQHNFDLPVLLLLLGQNKSNFRIYGTRPGEPLSFNALQLYLRSVSPEANDLFLLGLLLVQMFVLLSAALCQGGVVRRTLSLLASLFCCNAFFLLLCLPLIGLFSLQWTYSLRVLLLKCILSAAHTSVADAIRRDVASGALNPTFFTLVFILYLFLVAFVEHWRTGGQVEEFRAELLDNSVNSSISDRISTPHPFIFQYRSSLGSQDVESEYLHTLLNSLRSLNSSSLWIPAQVSEPSYLRTLPVWTHGGETDTHMEHLTGEECSVCLETYVCKDRLCCLPCAHAFHEACVMRWLSNNQHACPICRWPPYKQKEKHL